MTQRKRRMHCIHCESTDTVKSGKRILTPLSLDRKVKRKVQRYLCNTCKRTFSKRKERRKKFSMGFKVELTRNHVEERMSYRVISKRIKEKTGKQIWHSQICKMVNEVAKKSKGSLEIKNEYSPVWEGHLVVDDKYINIKGNKYISLIASDTSGYIVHEELLEEGNQESYDSFFRYIKDRLNYPFKSVTTDLDEMLEKSIRVVIGKEINHQKCTWHGLEAIKRTIGYKETANKYRRLERLLKKAQEELEDRKQSYERHVENIAVLKRELEMVSKKYHELEKLIEEIRKILYCKNSESTKKQLKNFKTRRRNKYLKVIEFLERHIEGLTMYQKDSKIPRTSNIAENINKQIVRRLKTIEAFQHFESASNYLNMLCNYLRFKPYTDCRKKRKYRNKKSPIELC
jgi:hypothetical protein